MSTCCSKLCQVLSMLLLMQLSGIICIFINFLPYRRSLWNASRVALPVNQCIESFPELCNSFYRNLSNIFWEQCQATANCIQPLSWDACTMVNSKGKKHHFACKTHRNVLCETLRDIVIWEPQDFEIFEDQLRQLMQQCCNGTFLQSPRIKVETRIYNSK